MGKLSNFENSQKSPLLENSDKSKDAFDKIVDCKIRLIAGSNTFFGKFSLSLEFIEDLNLQYKTMATDGMKIYYDPDFVLKHSEEEIRWVICHEIMHCALFHFIRRQANPTAWNAAADYALNQLIDPESYTIPPGDPQSPEVRKAKIFLGALGKMIPGCLNTRPATPDNPYGKPEYKGWSAEQIYDHIIENNVQLPPEEGWNYGGVTPPEFTGSSKKKSAGATGPSGPIAKIGDFVKIKSGGFGRITSIDANTGEAMVDPYSEADAIAQIEKQSGRKVISIK